MAKKKKLRKSKRPGFKPKPMYSVHKMVTDTELCYKTKGEIRKVFIKELSKYYLEWSKQQYKLGLINTRAVEITDRIDAFQKKGHTLKQENKLLEAEENYGRARFMLDFTVYHLGKTHKDFFQDDKWNEKKNLTD